MNTKSNTGELVLVTGGSGFITVHCILQLIKAGYRARATLRDVKRKAAVGSMLAEGGVEAVNICPLSRPAFRVMRTGMKPQL